MFGESSSPYAQRQRRGRNLLPCSRGKGTCFTLLSSSLSARRGTRRLARKSTISPRRYENKDLRKSKYAILSRAEGRRAYFFLFFFFSPLRVMMKLVEMFHLATWRSERIRQVVLPCGFYRVGIFVVFCCWISMLGETGKNRAGIGQGKGWRGNWKLNTCTPRSFFAAKGSFSEQAL